MSEEEIRTIEARWKSDVDKKLDKLLSFHETYGPLLIMLTEREERRRRVQQAIIEKSLAGLIYAGVIALIGVLITGTKEELRLLVDAWNAGKKP